MLKILSSLFLFLLPVIAFGANDIFGLIDAAKDIVGITIPVVASIALLVFLWGIAKFIFKSSDSEAKEDGKRLMIWGAIALFVMFSIWGIVAFLQDTFGLPRDYYNVNRR